MFLLIFSIEVASSAPSPQCASPGLDHCLSSVRPVRDALDWAANLTSVAGRPIRPVVLYKDAEAQIIQVDDFLTAAECEHLVGLVQGVVHGPPVPAPPSPPRPWFFAHRPDAWTQRCVGTCSSDAVLNTVDRLVADFTARPKTHLEHYQLLHYEVGQRYGEHHDFVHAQSQLPQGPRQFTLLLYLNDVEEGGETHFRFLDDLAVRPKRGRAVLWPNVDYDSDEQLNHKTHHSALPVIKGQKYGISQWVHKGDFRTLWA